MLNVLKTLAARLTAYRIVPVDLLEACRDLIGPLTASRDTLGAWTRLKVVLTDPVAELRVKPTPPPPLKVGDRVRALRQRDSAKAGMVGRVISIGSGTDGGLGVEFDEPFGGSHDCSGRGKNGHCHWMLDSDLGLETPFKVGDRVRLGTNVEKSGMTTLHYRSETIGQTGRIVDVYSDRLVWCFDGESSRREVFESMLERIDDATPDDVDLGVYTREYVESHPDEFNIEGDGGCGEDHDLIRYEGRREGRDQVTDDPGSYDLYTVEDIDSAREEGERAGRDYVIENAGEFDLVDRSDGFIFDDEEDVITYALDNSDRVADAEDVKGAIVAYLKGGREAVEAQYGYFYFQLFPEDQTVDVSGCATTVDLSKLAVVIPTEAQVTGETETTPRTFKAGDMVTFTEDYHHKTSPTSPGAGVLIERVYGYIGLWVVRSDDARNVMTSDGNGFYVFESCILDPETPVSYTRTLNLSCLKGGQ